MGGAFIDKDEYGFTTVSSVGIRNYRTEIGRVSSSLSQKYGDILTGINKNTLTFQKGTKQKTIDSYVKDALEGARLYRKWDNSTSAEVDKQMDDWYNKMRGKK